MAMHARPPCAGCACMQCAAQHSRQSVCAAYPCMRSIAAHPHTQVQVPLASTCSRAPGDQVLLKSTRPPCSSAGSIPHLSTPCDVPCAFTVRGKVGSATVSCSSTAGQQYNLCYTVLNLQAMHLLAVCCRCTGSTMPAKACTTP
jgi:hypothetical protein